MSGITTGQKRGKGLLFWAAASLAFAVIHNKSPLYSSNETTKLLHGMALAGRGDLKSDWFANTTDPLPFFSWFIAASCKILGEWSFYAYYAALLGVFLYAMVSIFSETAGIDRSRGKLAAFLAVLALLSSKFIQATTLRLAHFNLYALLTGVADQYLINQLFQNSLFGVFLLLSIALFLKKRPWLAALSLGIAATVHSAYLFVAAALTVAYMIRLYRDDRGFKRPLLLGLFTLALVAPIVVYTYRATPVSSAKNLSDEALSIIVTERIPHHSLASVWLDAAAWVKIALVAAAIYVNRRTRLFEIFLVPFAFAVIGTAAQLATGSLALDLVAPWRASVVLVPLATLSLCSAALEWAFDRGPFAGAGAQRAVFAVSAAAISICFAVGIYTQYSSFKSAAASPARALAAYVEGHREPKGVYLLEPDDSSLEGFRILAGAPIVVNWKSHPYKVDEVLEWHARYEAASSFYKAKGAAEARRLLGDLEAKYGATDLVVKKGSLPWIGELGLPELYSNSRYTLYRLPDETRSTVSK